MSQNTSNQANDAIEFKDWLVKNGHSIDEKASKEEYERLHNEFLKSKDESSDTGQGEDSLPEDGKSNTGKEKNNGSLDERIKKSKEITVKEYLAISKYPRSKKERFFPNAFMRFLEVKKQLRPRKESDWNKLYDEYIGG